jgi:O-methyltransferase
MSTRFCSKLRRALNLRNLRVKIYSAPGDLEVVDRSVWTTFKHGSADLDQYYRSLGAVGGMDSDNFYKQLRFLSLMQALELVLARKVPGELAECGVWRGHSAHMVASRLQDLDRRRKFHIFDSFQGLSDRGPLDNSRSQMGVREREREKNHFAVSLPTVQKNLCEFDFLEYHAGWIPDRFADVADTAFAFVHLDLDLYQPIFDSLKFFASRMSPGGVIVIDDYGHSDFEGAKLAVDDFLKGTDSFEKFEIPMGGAFLSKSFKQEASFS